MAEPQRRYRVESDHYDEIYIAERVGSSGGWTVEAYLKDGAVEQAIFLGPDARDRADTYLKSQYGEIIGAGIDPPPAPPTAPD